MESSALAGRGVAAVKTACRRSTSFGSVASTIALCRTALRRSLQVRPQAASPLLRRPSRNRADARTSAGCSGDRYSPTSPLTPGVSYNVGVAQICVVGQLFGFATSPTPEKGHVYSRYHVVWVPYQHEVDHLISLELGGSNAIKNLGLEPYAGRWGAQNKDVLENRLHDPRLCRAALPCVGAAPRGVELRVAALPSVRRVFAYGFRLGNGDRIGQLRPERRRLLRIEIPEREHHLLRRRLWLERTFPYLPGSFPNVRPGNGPLPRATTFINRAEADSRWEQRWSPGSDRSIFGGERLGERLDAEPNLGRVQD